MEIISEIQSDKIIQIDQLDRSIDRQAGIITKLDTKPRKVLPHRDKQIGTLKNLIANFEEY